MFVKSQTASFFTTQERRLSLPIRRCIRTQTRASRSNCHRSFKISTNPRFQDTVDVVIVGSGSAGLAAALRCHHHGLKPLVVEASAKVGGTLAWSGGGLWIPNNDYHRIRGVEDSEETALAYLEALVGDHGPATSRERKLAYIRNGSKMMNFLRDIGFEWVPTPGLPDYHAELPGGLPEGRSIEAGIFDLKKLGKWRSYLMPPSILKGPPMFVSEGLKASKAASSLSGAGAAIKIFLRWLWLVARGQEPVTLGQSMIGQMLYLLPDRDGAIWRSSPLQRLVMQDGRVTGVVVQRDGKEVAVRATKGVMLAAGGFAKNKAMREQYQQAPTNPAWSSANPSDMGDAIRAAMDIGAATSLMEYAWWGPTMMNPIDGQPWFSMGERGVAGSIIVDSSGKRFINEGVSYMDFGYYQYQRDSTVPCIPAWMVFDSTYERRMPLWIVGPRLTLSKALACGFVVEGKTVAELGHKIGVDAAGLEQTVQRFNGFARIGVDEDFNRGGTAFDKAIAGAQPRDTRNHSLEVIEKGPFYAMRMFPGDIGTKGGLLTDEHARVMGENGRVIPGLYASGNTSASVMGRRYAGAGATLGPAVVFGCLGVDHMATQQPEGEQHSV